MSLLEMQILGPHPGLTEIRISEAKENILTSPPGNLNGS